MQSPDSSVEGTDRHVSCFVIHEGAMGSCAAQALSSLKFSIASELDHELREAPRAARNEDDDL